MNTMKQITTALLTISLMVPPTVFADHQPNPQQQVRQAQNTAQLATRELEKAGTEFYLDSKMQVPANLEKLALNSNLNLKLYAVSPYDPEFNTRVAFSESIKSTSDGQMKITFEVLQLSSAGLKPYSIRAIKTVSLSGKDATQAKIESRRAVQAALNIAKNQLSVGKKTTGTFEKFASKAMDLLMPSANAKILAVAENIIMTAAGVIMIRYGVKIFKSEGQKGAIVESELISFALGAALCIMGGRLVLSGMHGLSDSIK